MLKDAPDHILEDNTYFKPNLCCLDNVTMHSLKLLSIIIIIILLIGCLVTILLSNTNTDRKDLCENWLTDSERVEIASYQNLVNKIIEETTTGFFKGSTFDELSFFIDEFGNRIAGSENLDNAIDYLVERSENRSLENVHTEEVLIESWNR